MRRSYCLVAERIDAMLSSRRLHSYLKLCASMHCSHDVTMRGSEAVSERCKVNREEKRSFEVTEWTLNRAKKRDGVRARS